MSTTGSTTTRYAVFVLVMVAVFVLIAAVTPVAAVSSSRTYTLDAHFDEGVLVGVEHDTVADQLQLSGEVTTYPIMWIANAGEDTLSKWDTINNVELARYHTWFGAPANHTAWIGPSPSRTAVDLDGNCYVANRHFDGKPADVIKILADDWIDRNGNGVLDTSYDADSDGTIIPSEMLPMTDSNSNGIIDDSEINDERIAWAVSVGPNSGLGRSLAIDLNGNIWLGLYNTQVYYQLSGADGSILAGPINVNPNTPYGALVDRHGVLWGASLGSTLLKLDTSTKAVTVLYHGNGSDYGIALGYDSSGNTHVYQASSSGSTYIEYNSGTGVFSTPAALLFPALGVAVDSNGDILASHYTNGSLTKFTPGGSIIWSKPAQVSTEARGTIIDSNNNVWVIHRPTHQMAKFDGSTGAPLGVFNTGRYPYTYSDATGLGLRSSITAFGTWTVIFDSGAADTPWGTVSWNSSEPVGTSVIVRVRSSNDQMSWSSWETVTASLPMTATSDGRYLEIETALQITSGDVSPILYDLTVQVGNQPPVADPNGSYFGPVNSLIAFDGSGSSDPDGDPLTYAWTFGDSSPGTGEFPSHAYSVAGIYDVCLIVNDGYVNSDQVCTFAVIYDPEGGFVTGGGWIYSDPGAYLPDDTLEGKATFGFISKYKKGAEVPTGNTEFQFHAGGLNFHSSSYDWLVVTGSDYAMFKGEGTINGGLAPSGNLYKFRIWAGDDVPDTFRIKIWDEIGVTEIVEYDNLTNQPLGSGSIIIHTKK